MTQTDTDTATGTGTGTATATAAASGAAATEQFRGRRSSGTPGADTQRVDTLVTELLTATHDIIRRHEVTYEEYNALKAWLIQVGEDGEWPLFLDVWVEHVVEEVAGKTREGSEGTIEGPYYVPDAPALPADATLPMRKDEAGTPLLFQGRVTSVDGSPLSAARAEIWQADGAGYYSQFAPNLPQWNLRGTVIADESGSFRIHTIQPAPYRIPTDGACGSLLTAAGWHPWRPAHLHLKVSAPGHQLVTTQLYFRDGEYVDDDIASAVKPALILDPKPSGSGNDHEVTYDFVLDRA
ncbi:catechol 1,2-dioxygenase [Streptomyces sp. NBC_00455]|uniref:catechol 1,2-dioxygenase n=1 Tax=Streptomyces sp. NBC_00455 TaxID=2903654 RepID=UPI002E20D3C8